MWFETPVKPAPWDDAIAHLTRADAKMARLIAAVGPCTLAPRRDYFVALCKAVYSQQLSTVVAATLFGRFRNQFPNRRPTPALTLKLLAGDPQTLRGCGLSRNKTAYLKDLAEHFVSGKIPTRRLFGMTDQEVIEALTAVKGIGLWTAEMFLMFVLNRPDVFPVGDLGLRVGMQELHNLAARPAAGQMIELAESWRPYRSIATWYIWRRNAAAPEASSAVIEGGIV